MLLGGAYGLPPEKRVPLETAKLVPESTLSDYIHSPGNHIKGFVFRDHQPAYGSGFGNAAYGELYMGDGLFINVDVNIHPPGLAMRALARVMRREPRGVVTIVEHWSHDI